MSYSMTADGGPDDLPRTLRRERDAREREAREREAAERAQAEREQLAIGHGVGAAMGGAAAPIGPAIGPSIGPAPIAPARMADDMYVVPHGYPTGIDAAMPAVVTRYDVPFLHLVAFFFKVALAALPALLFLGVLIWGAGHLLQVYFPWLIKAQILIHFPN